uniref:Uncharacterized protein n=1 Tax=Glossina austeni TaxID=7395 RepID=A0A1A9VHZ0_GLOAU
MQALNAVDDTLSSGYGCLRDTILTYPNSMHRFLTYLNSMHRFITHLNILASLSNCANTLRVVSFVFYQRQQSLWVEREHFFNILGNQALPWIALIRTLTNPYEYLVELGAIEGLEQTYLQSNN